MVGGEVNFVKLALLFLPLLLLGLLDQALLLFVQLLLREASLLKPIAALASFCCRRFTLVKYVSFKEQTLSLELGH